MPGIDADTHVIECDDTWSYLRPDEQQWRPTRHDTDGRQFEWRGVQRFWYVGGQLIARGENPKAESEGPSAEVRNLRDVPGRLGWMDRLGVDVQILISTFFLAANIARPEAQVALSRSYNRWLAARCRESRGRLRWSVVPPLRDMAATIDELRFGAANGAVSVLLRPMEDKRLLSDPYLRPMLAEAERLDLALGIHIGNVDTPVYQQRDAVIFSVVPMAGAFVSLWVSDVPKRFPRLRFGFLEAGSEWLPFAFREISRGADGGMRQFITIGEAPLRGSNFFVAGTMDEDLPYVMRFAGGGNLVLGTDFGHQDLGSDIEAHRLLPARNDVGREMLPAVADRNGRALYALD
jgi:predicted TIM-barrel fold metal-dependent hydrolase